MCGVVNLFGANIWLVGSYDKAVFTQNGFVCLETGYIIDLMTWVIGEYRLNIFCRLFVGDLHHTKLPTMSFGDVNQTSHANHETPGRINVVSY